MMMMSITFAMPAMAGNKNNNHGKNDKAVVVNNDKKDSHFDKADKKTMVSTNRPTVSTNRPTVSTSRPTVSTSSTSHFDANKTHAYRPDVKTTTIKVGRHDSHKKVVAKVENMKGVMDTNWNPRTRELTVRYDANKTSARNIKHFVA